MNRPDNHKTETDCLFTTRMINWRYLMPSTPCYCTTSLHGECRKDVQEVLHHNVIDVM